MAFLVEPGLVAEQHGVTVALMAVDVAGGRIRHIWAVRNPDKLRPWTTANDDTGSNAGPRVRGRTRLAWLPRPHRPRPAPRPPPQA
jgi:hypothetical protein